MIIIVLVYVANIFLNRFLTFLTVRNEGQKIGIMTYDWQWLWFVPVLGNTFCVAYFIVSLKRRTNWFTGKYW